MIVSSKSSHKIKSSYTLFGIRVNVHFDISEVTSLEELVGVFIELGVLIIDLNLMECVVSHSSGVNDESTLGDVNVAIFLVIVVILLFIVDDWENWIRVTNDLARDELANIADFKESPVEETTFVELSEVQGDLDGLIILVKNIRFINLMPGDDMLVISLNWRRCR
tara:strand:+ start:2541 stop:3038 length:498 start_codon:yes stop_codon:yes gene_type:complete